MSKEKKALELDNLDPEEKFKADLKALLESDETDNTEENLDTEEVSDEEVDDAEKTEDEFAEEDSTEETEIPDDTDDEVPVIAKKVSSKEQEKIIALKRELRESKEKLAAAESKSKEVADTKQMDSLVSKFTDAGYDEDTSKQYAKTEFEMQDLNRRLAVSDFKAENAELFAVYPEAKANVDKILQTMNTTGFSAKQVCRALYDEDTSPAKERAKQAVSGTLPRTPSNNSVSNATRSAGSAAAVSLTQSQRIQKKDFERKFPSLSGMTDKEFLECGL